MIHSSEQDFLFNQLNDDFDVNTTDASIGVENNRATLSHNALSNLEPTPALSYGYFSQDLNTSRAELNPPSYTTAWQPPRNTTWQPSRNTTWQPSRNTNTNNFTIEVVFGQGTSNFTPEMRAAVNEAADTWEDAILRSDFVGGHTLTIVVGGQNQGVQGFEAVAAPDLTPSTLLIDSDFNALPTRGVSIVNTNPQKMQNFRANTDYFTDLMTHEFGHVMGIGTLWERNNLIDPITGDYRANTEAGRVYNDRRIGQNADIPLTTGVGEGSDSLHWREEVFGNELMTHRLETPGASHPMSELTLASLEDIGWTVDYTVADAFPDNSTRASTIG